MLASFFADESEPVESTSSVPNRRVAAQSVEYFPAEGPIHRSIAAVAGLAGWMREDVRTLADIWRDAATRFADRPCMGSRYVTGQTKGPYVYKTYKEMNERVLNFASGLRHIGVKEHDRLGLYSVNNEHWVVGEQACYQQSFIVVSIYDTLGAEVCEFVINHADITTILCEANKLDNVMKAATKCPNLKTIIVMESVSEDQREKAQHKNLVVMSMREVEEAGRAHKSQVKLPHDADLCTIMYTSGTTGDPKGVMLSHGNVLAAITGGLQQGLHITSSDVHLSYLPMSHIFERVVVSALWANGAACAFFQGNAQFLLEDMQTAQPTLFFGVPRVFNKLHDKVMAGVDKAGGIKRWMFQTAYAARLDALRHGRDTPVWNRIVFNKIRDSIVGPRCRLLVSGSAPLSVDVQDFLRVIFGVPVSQGYGLTETAAACTLALPGDAVSGHVGPPMVCNEVRLVDVPEMGYTSSSHPQRGEVCVRGLNVFCGYYRNDEETTKVLLDDRWFHTGDIGQWNSNGTLSIIDRKKNIFKLSQGEYIAAEKLEQVFASSHFVQQLWIYGNSLQSTIIAIIVPEIDALAAAIGKKGSAADNRFTSDLCALPAARKAILDDITRLGKEAKLGGFEFPKGLHLEPEPWSIENGMLTPTFKLKRAELVKRYKANIDQMYQQIARAQQR
eukprot:TRINITY_DN7917_c0_g1_i1.p1 TRINITY_DN7917_c0_g1~~TRINITY_DN7917_c0_g1_i1.p1  ORF type:complete len:672 (-),score=122.89 TRINITY_DN7917_c0_g1_i1:107-2122(-)